MSNVDSDATTEEDPPKEPPGVRTDLFEHPDPAALASAVSGASPIAPAAPEEDPPSEGELYTSHAVPRGSDAHGSQAHGSDPADTRANDEDPPREADLA